MPKFIQDSKTEDLINVDQVARLMIQPDTTYLALDAGGNELATVSFHDVHSMLDGDDTVVPATPGTRALVLVCPVDYSEATVTDITVTEHDIIAWRIGAKSGWIKPVIPTVWPDDDRMVLLRLSNGDLVDEGSAEVVTVEKAKEEFFGEIKELFMRRTKAPQAVEKTES
jgi:hypothetical protein